MRNAQSRKFAATTNVGGALNPPPLAAGIAPGLAGREQCSEGGMVTLPGPQATPGEPAPLAGSLLAMPALDLGRVLRPLTQDDDILAEMLEGYFI